MTSNRGRHSTGQVITMDRFRSGKSLSPLHQAEAYWNALREGATVPRRSQIDPRGLENILEYAFIVERIAPGVARFRLAGHHLTELAGMEVRGMPLTAFFTASARDQIAAVLEHVFDAPAVAELTLGHKKKEARMILLPLQSDQGEVSRALGVLVADGPTSAKPVRFDVDATLLRPTTGMQAEPASLSLPAEPRVPENAGGFAEAQTPLAGRAPHLRLVK